MVNKAKGDTKGDTDESDIVRFHVSPVNFGKNAGREEIVIPLDNYVGMFELTEVTEVSAE